MSQPPQLAAVAKQLQPWPGSFELDEQIEVAGETYYIKEIKRLFRARQDVITERGSTIEQVMTLLLPTPWNEHDANAVAVLCEGYQVGHVPADLARDYHRPLVSLAQRGYTPVCWSRIWAKSDGGVVRARATVLAPESEVVSQLASTLEHQRVTIEPTASVAIEATTESRPAAGWYPDPSEMAPLRWWDGGQWTSRIRMKAD